MTRFTILYCRRSDGKLETGTHGKRERNQPTAPQLSQKPDAKGVISYYREITHDEAKHQDWRRKLAGMLIRQLGDAEQIARDKNFILHDLPENYRLFEHVKSRSTEVDGKVQKNPKTHAGGGHDRQDAYLYGHPLGRKKRYRSPAEFFPHLLWLSTDETGDRNNCSCKLCAPDDIQPEVKEAEGAKAMVAKKDESKAPKKKAMVALPNRQIPTPEAPPQAQPQAHPPVQVPSLAPQQRFSQASPQVPQHASHSPSPYTQVQGSRSQTSTPIHATYAQGQPATLADTLRGQMGTMPSPMVSQQHPAQPQQRPAQPQPRPAQPQQRPAPPTPSPLAQPRSQEQQLDLEYGRFIYRVGELVWFNRGDAWGLGVIMRRWFYHAESRGYLVQPLSHPFDQSQPAVVINLDSYLRPWLAWSAPSFTTDRLNQVADISYDALKWDLLLKGELGPGDPVIDASILAAKAIDKSWTPFELVHDQQNSPFLYWNGVYLGGERLWVGEAARLRMGGAEDVIVIAAIIERVEKNQPYGLSGQSPIFLMGDVYTLATVPDGAVEPPDQASLPPRMREDARYRNRVSTMSPTGARVYWKLVKAKLQVDFSNIKGRWYETSCLLPIIKGQAAFEEAARRGEIEPVGPLLNARVDCGPSAGRRFATRLEAFGKAVPQGSRLVDGIVPPSAPPQVSVPISAAQGSGEGQYFAGEGGGLEEFVNLEGEGWGFQ
ncbi:hypothetical protein EJ06DRAFT_266223 [Trichodelitschia bisporula]|uniref:Cryptic loci regulator 2 N-terminal domain-containing protein n=1 Tax=Trichodelitschia bisporula TaxID=703511 RepID=A0A6G1HHV4_9PEZI|nr:hypothetical protein EJ06DRAFT_266223 [Trichodelitschia bisporula]